MTQRKNYFIAKGMQSRFAGTILLLVFLITVITACNIYVLGSFFLTTQATLSEGQTAESMMRHFVTELWPRLLLLVLVNIPVYLGLGRLIFKEWDGFLEALRLWSNADWWFTLE
ncbi:MAG TPA: hypothetical protein PLY73_06615, partial [Candidatus Ozemobacteraceae bacterium]|nr:hypothetical protein [Candidatus Ozemobacteraceae bacterium]